jgi:hypothetical protein
MEALSARLRGHREAVSMTVGQELGRSAAK